MTQKTQFKNAERQQLSILTPLERITLRWLAERMPSWVNSDHLTVLGFAGMILTGLSYYLAQYNPLFLLTAIVCLAINWFGDSLDGTVARLRNRQRPATASMSITSLMLSASPLCVSVLAFPVTCLRPLPWPFSSRTSS
jgi:hypothetical protein